MTAGDVFGRTIQLFLVDGSPSGLIIASIHGWTGSVLVSTQSTFGALLMRPEVNHTEIYILYGPDPEDALRMRAYIGEADRVRERIAESAGKRGFWEVAVVVTTADEALTKGHVRYLEARLIEMTKTAGRVALDSTQTPEPDRRRLPEADRVNMEGFLANLKVVLPVIGIDLLKPQPLGMEKIGMEKIGAVARGDTAIPESTETHFEIHHRSGVKAFAIEGDGEFIVLAGSQALKDTEYARDSDARLKDELITDGTLTETGDRSRYEFTRAFAFKSSSAAGSIILDRNTNGRTRWYVKDTNQTYHEWQEAKAVAPEGEP